MRHYPRSILAAAVVLGAACSGSTTPPSPVSGPTVSTTTTVATVATLPPLSEDPALAAQLGAIDPSGCDPLDERACLLPFPSDLFTTSDAATDTDRRVAFPTPAMPVNAHGISVDPAEWNRNDGFSPNTPILAYVAGLDPAASGLPSWTDPMAGANTASPVVVVDLANGELVPLWAEPDAKATDDADRLLVIHPAVRLTEGHRYAVALRHLVLADGSPAEPSAAFRAYRDRIAGPQWIEARREPMEQMFAVLTAAGIDRDDLFLAWDFTVASTRSIAERMVHIRDDALATISAGPIAFTVDEVVPDPDADGLIARSVIGTFEVPSYLTGDGSPGNGFFYGSDGLSDPDELPTANGTRQASFRCNIPHAALDPAKGKSHLVLYGHGLLGSNKEINAGNVRKMAAEHDVIFCAVKWAGMSDDDIPNAVAALGDVSRFPTVADRLQQGVLDAIVLGRLMTAPDGLSAHLAFAGVNADLDHLDFDGNSQGGIMGLMLAAVSPDIERAVLGVPGMNYSMLLPRSVDFDTYEEVFAPAYPSELDRAILLGLLQMLWDRGEGGGYAAHVTDNPYPRTPAKTVLLDVAYGDHQVSELTALIEARAIGAAYHEPAATPERLPSGVLFGLQPIPGYPYPGSAIIVWDSGSPPIPLAQLPPRDGHDPHEDVRADPEVRRQKAAFLFDDELIDVCDGVCRVQPTD